MLEVKQIQLLQKLQIAIRIFTDGIDRNQDRNVKTLLMSMSSQTNCLPTHCASVHARTFQKISLKKTGSGVCYYVYLVTPFRSKHRK